MLQKKTMFTGIAIVCMSWTFWLWKGDELECHAAVKEVIEKSGRKRTAETGTDF